MKENYCGNEYRSTSVCIDSYENGVMTGSIHNPAFSEAIAFRSVMELLLEMEGLLDQMNFPKNFTTRRSFGAQDRLLATQQKPVEARGALASFIVKVLFRQNASWQGSLIWVDGRREECFRSVLELLFLMHSALSADKEQT